MATIPGPLENDAEDVSLALEVAQTQWARGDYTEALKWLRKAADAAFDAEDDKRGIELSKVAAEVTAHIKNQKPKPPPPRAAATKPHPPSAAPPPRQTAPPAPPRQTAPPPPARQTAPPAPPPRKPAPEPTKPRAKMDSTSGRRTAKAGPASRRSVPDEKLSATKPDAPPVDDEESTREYLLADVGNDPPAVSEGDEWPTESVDNLDDLESSAERASRRHADKQKSAKKKNARTGEHRAAVAKRTRNESGREVTVTVPSTRAVRVAAGRDHKGRIYVRLLDSQGLRDGEHDTMLVALTGEADLRDLFRDE